MSILRFNREAQALRKNIRKRHEQTSNKGENLNFNPELSTLTIKGGVPLKGRVNISGAKNSALPLLFATILANDIVTLKNVPNLSDIHVGIAILRELGLKVSFNDNTLIVNPNNLKKFAAAEKLMESMRASVLVLGPLLAKYHKAELFTPGGCTIGARPIDIHLTSLALLGAKEYFEGHNIHFSSNGRLVGTEINVEKSSVGATENLLMAASLAKGTTILNNAAKEPEIEDLANMLNSMGAKITGAGTNTIKIEGVESLGGTVHSVYPDRIEAASYLMAAAITRGDITLNNVNISHLENIICPLREVGCDIQILGSNSLRLLANKRLKAKDIITGIYPLFPTDTQPQWTALMCLAEGDCVIKETVFENRFIYTKELQAMGADLHLQGQDTCNVKGVESLKGGATVKPLDLRASFALIMAGLVANGTTIIKGLQYLDRGYEDAVNKLRGCGALIIREDFNNKSTTT